ncbi:hypothetical protein [Sediminibacterium ginsengisoli]|uniref:hypothetical protein n=1 Tax=Sediminibacterium ginsengisoli TaxID=413434 RepID=UPI00111684F1|nr:hypothetical protein [Sediminibacterium ginsengisoli]
MIIKIDLPVMDPAKSTTLVFFALPNGNSIEWTEGKKMVAGDDWHYDIQHIGAQTRYLRQVMKDQNLVTVYLANRLKSWPAWKRQTPNGPAEIRRIVDSVTGMFTAYQPSVVLNSHSGGSFIFGYIDAVKTIPDIVERICFIDSDYGYEDSMHTGKLVQWLSASEKHHLNVLAYNDSVVIYNGKPLVSPTGGTWYRSKLMQQRLSNSFRFEHSADTAFSRFISPDKRIVFLLKENPEGKIYHTEQVARNGFIHTLLSGTKYEKKAGYSYWGNRVYDAFISDK